MKRPSIIFAPRSFQHEFQKEPHPLDEVFEMLLAGQRYAVIACLQDDFPTNEFDENRLRQRVEADIVTDFEVEPPLKLWTYFKRAESGCRAITDFILE